MARFQVGDEVYIKGVVGEIESDDGTYPVRVNLIDSYRVDDFTLGGLAKITHIERSLFHASEIQSPMREYKIGQKLNGFAEVMRALINEQFVHVDGSIYKLDEFNILYLNGTTWDKTSRRIDAFTSGTIVEDPTPKKMVAYQFNDGNIVIKPDNSDYIVSAQRLNKQELAAILERVE